LTRDTFDMFAEPERGRFGENETQHRPGRGPRVTGASDLIDLTLQVVRDNPLSLIVRDPAKPHLRGAPLPKSLIEYREIRSGIVEVSLPSWLAKEKGLI
jgi:hypothetical protein